MLPPCQPEECRSPCPVRRRAGRSAPRSTIARCGSVGGVWRVWFRIYGREDDWNSFEDEADARAFLAGILEDDTHGLLLDTSLDEWDGDTWAPRT
jgi:hypothetical protein